MKRKSINQVSVAFVFGLLASAALPTYGQSAKSLPLSEAIKLSLQNSGQLKISNAKADEASATYKDAKNNYLPDFKATGAYLRVNNPSVDLKVKLNLGGSVKPVTVNQAAYGMVSGSLPIFSGLRIKYGVESAKYLQQAAKLDVENDREDLIENTVNAYSNLFKAKNTVDLVSENLAREKQRVKDFTNLANNGLLTKNDLLKAELQESNIELALLDAQSNLKVAMVNMDLMLGFPESTELLPDTTLLVNPGDAGTLLQWEQTAFQNRKDASALAIREKASESFLKSVKGQYYPGIALTGGLITADIPNLLTINDALNVGIGLQYNLAALWKTGAKVEQAKAQLRQVQATEGLLADGIRLQVNKSYEDYLLSIKKIDVYARAVAQANENYRITKNKHDNSLATTTDLIDADVAQLQAMLNFAFSKIDASVAYKKLQQTAGVLEKKQ